MHIRLLSTITILTTVSFFSCQKEDEKIISNDKVSEEAVSKIHQLGFSTQNLQKVEGGYLVEGDIVLAEAELNQAPDYKLLRVGTEEQYRTNNLVSRLPRVITISITSQLPASYVTALDEAIARYNAEKLRITFKRVSGEGGAINIVVGTGSYLASSGFPSNGNPYNRIKVNPNVVRNQPKATVATILAHEIGHCIGFRHTDYMNRAYSCGGLVVNEGADTKGAINIPGTPTKADPNSWMLACISGGENRPFNTNDKKALNYLY